MKTSTQIIQALVNKNIHFGMSLDDFARVLPGLSKHQISCSLTRLVQNRKLVFILTKTHCAGSVYENYKDNRVYSINPKNAKI